MSFSPQTGNKFGMEGVHSSDEISRVFEPKSWGVYVGASSPVNIIGPWGQQTTYLR